MDDSKLEAIAKSVEKIAESRGASEIGSGLGMGFGFLGLALFLLAAGVGINWDGRLFAETKCYELKELSGTVFKLNTCTGEVEELKTDSVTE